MSELKDRYIQIIQSEEQKEKRMKKINRTLENMGHHYTCQHVYNGHTTGRGERDGYRSKYLKK